MSSSDDAIVLADDVTITAALACDSISQDPQQRLYIHGVIDQLNAPNFPVTTASLFVVFGFQRRLPGFLMQCVVDILPETGDPVASQAIADVVFRPAQANNRQIIGFAGVTWPKPGNYTVRFRSRGNLIASFILPLVHVQLPGAAKR